MTYQPRWTVPTAIRNGPGNPRTEYKSVSFREEENKARRVSKVIVEGPDNFNFRPRETVYNIGGDHLYCDELVGSHPAFIRLDGRDAPPIRLEEGMTLRRPFHRFIVSFDHALFQDDRDVPLRSPSTRVTLYATYGPFIIDKPDKMYGAHPGFVSRFDCDATTTPRLVYQDLLTEFTIFSANPEEMFGRGGATVMLKNTDAANTLFVKYTDQHDVAPAKAATFRNWYPLDAGEPMSMTVESLIKRAIPGEGGAGISLGGIYVATLVGSCKYAYLISRSPVFGPTSSGYRGVEANPT